jgi:hypothetical protein
METIFGVALLALIAFGYWLAFCATLRWADRQSWGAETRLTFSQAAELAHGIRLTSSDWAGLDPSRDSVITRVDGGFVMVRDRWPRWFRLSVAVLGAVWAPVWVPIWAVGRWVGIWPKERRYARIVSEKPLEREDLPLRATFPLIDDEAGALDRLADRGLRRRPFPSTPA